MQQQAADGHPVQQAVQRVVAAFAELQPVLPDGGQRRGGVGAEGQVVEADDAQLFGHPDAQLEAADEGGVGHQVVAAQNGRHPLREHPGQVGVHALGEVVRVPRHRVAGGQLAAAHLVEKALVPHLIDVAAQRAAQIADAAVAHGVQRLDGLADGLVVVDAEGGDGGVAPDEVVVQHRRGVAAGKVLHPWVEQGQAQKQRPDVALPQHIGVVRGGLLYLFGQGDHSHAVAHGLGHLTEAGDDVGAEILGFGVVHVLDEDGEGARRAPPRPGVAEGDRRVQDGLAQALADVGRAVQRFGHRPLCDAYLFCNIVHGRHCGSPPFLWPCPIYYNRPGGKTQTAKLQKKFRTAREPESTVKTK